MSPRAIMMPSAASMISSMLRIAWRLSTLATIWQSGRLRLDDGRPLRGRRPRLRTKDRAM